MIRVLSQERPFLLRRPWVLASWLLLTGLVVLAMMEGRRILEVRQQAVAKFSDEIWSTFEERRTAAGEVAAGTRKVKNPREAFQTGRVNGIRVPVALEVSPLQAWSPGLWAGHPTIGSVGIFSSPSGFLELAIPRDPKAEAWGRLDLTMVVVILLPLWLLLVFHDTCSHERDRGLFRILQGNGVPRRRILLRRLATPVAIAVIGWSASFLVGCVATGSWDATGRAGWRWFAVSLGYTTFWMGCFAWIASRARSTETSVTSALATWIVVVILLPGLMDVVLRATTNPAVGTDVVSRQRTAAAAAERERAKVLSKYMFDHPELAAQENQGRFASDFLRRYFVTQETVESRLAPVTEQQEAANQTRLDSVGWLSTLVPSAWTQGLLEETAGTGPRQMLEFRTQSRAFAHDLRANLRPFLWSGHLLTPEDFDRVPRFASAPGDHPSGLRLLWLPALGVLGLLLAWRRWTHAPVIATASNRGTNAGSAEAVPA